MTTASGAERSHNCPASEVLPRAGSTSDLAERGNAIHRFTRRVLAGMPKGRALAMVPEEWRATCARLDFRAISGDISGVRSEVAYAYNVRTAEVRELGIDIGRAYPSLGPAWICGSGDVEGLRIDGVPVTADLKSGHGDVTYVEDNYQVRFFARVLQQVHGAAEVEGRILRIRGDGSVWPRSFTFDAFALDAYGDTLIEIVDGVARMRALQAEGKPLPVNEGSWCKYCPAFHACPAKNALAKSMLPDLDAMRARVATMTTEERGKAWETYKKIKPVYEAIEKALKEAAASEALPLPNGKYAAEISFERESFDKVRALTLLRQHGATDDEIASCTTSTTCAQIREVKRPPRRVYGTEETKTENAA